MTEKISHQPEDIFRTVYKSIKRISDSLSSLMLISFIFQFIFTFFTYNIDSVGDLFVMTASAEFLDVLDTLDDTFTYICGLIAFCFYLKENFRSVIDRIENDWLLTSFIRF